MVDKIAYLTGSNAYFYNLRGLKAIASVASMTLFTLDRPWMVTVSSAMMAGMFAILCIPLTRIWGIEGTAGAVVVSGILSHLVAITMAAICVQQGCTVTTGAKDKG
jgi:O-antigen/teichoic acid export membrane protein